MVAHSAIDTLRNGSERADLYLSISAGGAVDQLGWFTKEEEGGEEQGEEEKEECGDGGMMMMM